MAMRELTTCLYGNKDLLYSYFPIILGMNYCRLDHEGQDHNHLRSVESISVMIQRP